MEWLDIEDIAIKLEEFYPDVNILDVRFTDLYSWIKNLPGFKGDLQECNEKILEAIQMSWLNERKLNQ